MGTRLSDGTVVMSGFGVEDNAQVRPTGSAALNTLGVYAGEVLKAIYPEERDNSSEVVYLVEVRPRQGFDTAGPVLWKCRLATSFEGSADYIRTTLRPATYDSDGKLVRNGAKVLVAAVNGDVSQAFIIGCVKQQSRRDRARKNKQKVNREMEAEFNGVHFYVEDDGSFSVQVPGATDQDGNADPERDENNKGTFVRFDKTGEVTLSDQNGESLRISPKEKLVEVLSNDVTVTAGGKVTVTSKLAMLLSTEDSATIKAKKTYIGNTGASENLVLGQKLVSALNDLAEILLSPNVSMSGNLGYPVPANPETLAKVAEWKAKWLVGAPATILARNKFTER